MISLYWRHLLVPALVAGLAGCGAMGADSSDSRTQGERKIFEGGKATDEGGLLSFGGSKSKSDQGGGVLGVNSFLWRASLDTLSFLPLASADPFGGVIITDWYTPSATPSERFKVTVYILDRTLRADGIRVAVFRQVRQAGGGDGWADQAVAPETQVNLENAILTRARELRVASAGL